MRVLPLILPLLLSAPLLAQSRDREILKCLGAEEKRLHLKKDTGPIYDLNQRIIGELIQIPKVELTPEANKEVCNEARFSESVKMLELSLKKGASVFVIPKDVQGMQRKITEGMIEDYVEISREIFLNFIAAIQQNAPTASCLQEEIPQLETFFTEIKYLQEDVDMKSIFNGKYQKIFNQLKNYPRAFERCRVRLKKKPKSESTERDKKS